MDYSETKKKKPSNNRPLTDYAETKQSINIKIERISNLKKAIYIRNQQRDKILIEDIDDNDVDEIQNLIEESDDEIPSNIEEIVPSKHSNTINDEEVDDTIQIVADNAATALASHIATGIHRMEIDEEFSVQYSYTTGVSNSYRSHLIN